MHTTPILRDSLVRNIVSLAKGEQSRGLLKQLRGSPKILAIFESPVKSFADGDRFLWTRSVAYSQRIQGFTDFITLWRICKHDDVPKGMDWIIDSHKIGRRSTMKKALKPTTHVSMLTDGRRIPRQYEPIDGVDMQSLEEHDQAKFQELTSDEWEVVLGVEQREMDQGNILFTPPAVSNADSCNLLKFYQLNDEVLTSLFVFHLPSEQKGLEQKAAVPEFPFMVDHLQDRLIHENLGNNQHSAVLLCGRSGTGKTSIALNRMWAFYKYYHSPTWHDDPRNQIFVTANRILRNEVRKSFAGMKHGFYGREMPVFTDYPPTLSDIPEEMFPLFLTQAEWLKMLDGTLKEPFWPRNEDGSLKHTVISAFHEEEGMLDVLPEDDFDDEWSDSAEEDESGELDCLSAGAKRREAEEEKRPEVDFTVFCNKIWPRITSHCSKTELKYVSSASLWTEIHSYIKGSADAVRSKKGRLTREEYNALGVKMAPLFKQSLLHDLPGDRSGSRDLVYDLFERYQCECKRLNGYDLSDVVFHIYTQLQQYPDQKRTPVHSMFVDETQDFTQAELSLFLRVVEDKNDLVCCVVLCCVCVCVCVCARARACV